MHDEVFRQYKAESDNWLKSGRCALLRALLEEAGGGRRDLEILEIGAGVGQNVPILSEFGRVDVAEISEVGLEVLRGRPEVERIYDQPIPFELAKPYDIICAFDVVEHLEDDRGAAAWIGDGLKPGGSFIATVPAYQWLFSDHDVALGHYRRYTKNSFNAILPARLRVVKTGYFNSTLFPIPAAGRLVKKLRRARMAPSRRRGQGEHDRAGLARSDFRSILSAEVGIIRRRPLFPFGLSVFSMAQKVS